MLKQFKTKTMAGIDKIYLTGEQYDEFKDWIYSRSFWIMLLTWRNPCYFYEIPAEAFDIGFEQKEYPATNYPHIIDKFLFLHCKLPYIQKRLKEQYGSIWECFRPYWVYVLGTKISNLIRKDHE